MRDKFRSENIQKDLLFMCICDTLTWRMEVGLFFMPKFGSPANCQATVNLKQNKARWKLCVQESHWNVQNVSSVTTA